MFSLFADSAFQLSNFYSTIALTFAFYFFSFVLPDLTSPAASHYPSLYLATLSCLSCLTLIFQPSSFHLNFLPPASLFFFYPPSPFPTLQFSPWSVAGLENRPRAIADASIFGHADGTEGWGSHTTLLQIPSHSSLPSIHPTLLPSLFCAIILVQGVPHSLPVLPPFLFSLHLLYIFFKSYSRDLIKHPWAACLRFGPNTRPLSHHPQGMVGYRKLVLTGTNSKRLRVGNAMRNNNAYRCMASKNLVKVKVSFCFLRLSVSFHAPITWNELERGFKNNKLISRIGIRINKMIPKL